MLNHSLRQRKEPLPRIQVVAVERREHERAAPPGDDDGQPQHAAELVIDANRVVDIAYEDRGVLGLTVVVSGRGGAFMLATLDGDDLNARERFFGLAE